MVGVIRKVELEYKILDVFTDQRLQGNPLALVLGADDLSPSMMQSIAREFNLSETAFVCQPKFERHTASLRIFTPTEELPFGGHPTLGAAVYLGIHNRSTAVRLEETLGTITCVMEPVDKRTGSGKFSIPKLPERLDLELDDDAIADALGIPVADIGFGNLRPSAWSAGISYVLVPVNSQEVLSNLQFERRGWADVFPIPRNAAYIFAPTPDERGTDYAARMMKPGVTEDPATGAAAAALAGMIAYNDPDPDLQLALTIRQGREIGRTSRIEVNCRKSEGKITTVGIGGRAVIVAAGKLDLT